MEIIDNLIDFWNSNPTGDYLIALAIFAGLTLIFKVFDSSLILILERTKKKTKNKIDDFVIDFINEIHLPFYIYLSFYIATLFLNVPQGANRILGYILFIFVMFYLAKGFGKITSTLFDKYKEKRKRRGEPSNESMIDVLKFMAKLVIWVMAFLLILTNLGIEVTPLLAGIGIGGLAIGLALQNILGDLFAAFTIYFDKPFKEGDFIIVGSDMGVIKHIGIKSTRIEALGGQELVMSNSALTSTPINNYKKMNNRRVVFSFGVEYKTKVEQLKKIKDIVKKIINKEDHATLDRVHFKEFADSSLNFEVVYYIDSNDYNIYMDVQEKINLEIKKQVEKIGVDFAFPSRSVYMKK